ncbi:MAG: ATP-binding protein [Deltaproteobacteria bacterium]|nr:ATP-binding protein [Deltaproteobacteria bacterium]
MHPFSIRLPADLTAIPRVHEELAILADRKIFSADVRDALGVALDEVLVNVVMHGYGSQPGEISLSFSLEASPRRFVVEVEDAAPSFDPLARADPPIDEDVEARQVGGLGIYLVKNLMDDVQYRRHAGHNYLRLIKALGPSGEDPLEE